MKTDYTFIEMHTLSNKLLIDTYRHVVEHPSSEPGRVMDKFNFEHIILNRVLTGKLFDEDVIDEKMAREIAMDWHGGQSTALYEFGSSGKTVDKKLVLAEITSEIYNVFTSTHEKSRLRCLHKYITKLHV